MHEAWALARQAWPRVALERDVFVRHCERVLGEAPVSSWAPHGTELYLCCACALGDEAAQAVLSTVYLARLERQLSDSNDDPELVQESLQALRIKLLVGTEAKIGRFAGRGPLGHWLRAAAKRTLLDVVRARRAQRQAERRAEREVRVEACVHEPDPVAAIGQARYARTFLDGLRESIAVLDEPDRVLIKHAILDGSTIDVLGGLYAIHRSTASRRLRRIRREVAQAVRRQLKARHRLSDGEVDELARELGDWLEPGLRAILESA
jgi:RNA polymerase sigma-70 factor (ECF subfamily)